LIKVRIVEGIVFRRLYKYLNMFKKKVSKRILMKKIWNYGIDLREEFVSKKKKIYLLLKIQKEEV